MSPWEETEDYIRSGHRNPDDFKSLKTITISAEQGIKAIVGRPKGKDTTEIQSYLFSKDKGWTVAKAKAWFKEHRERRISIIAPVKEKLLSEPRKVSGILALPGWSRNMNLWLPDEIEQLQAAFVHAPIYYEHIDSRNVVGQTDFVAFDPELGLLAFYGGIFDEDTADKIDKGLISFVSLGVNYTRLDQVNGVIPRGPYHDGEISLVAVPGVQGTSIQVAEKLQGEKKRRDKMSEHETGEPKTGTHGTETGTSHTPDTTDPASEPKKPTMSENIEKELNDGAMGLAAKEAGYKIKVTQEGPQTFKIGVVKEGQAAEQETPKSGEPKTDRGRLMAHFGEEMALKLFDLIGDEAYKLLPPRGTKVGTAGKEQLRTQSVEDELVWLGDRIDSIWNSIGDIQRDVYRHEEAIKEINEKIFLLAKESESDKPPQDEDRGRDKPTETGKGGEGTGDEAQEKATSEPKPPEGQPADDDKTTITPPPPEPEPKTPEPSKAPPIAEGVVDPSAKPVVPNEFVRKEDILALLPGENVFKRAPFQLTELVRKIKAACK